MFFTLRKGIVRLLILCILPTSGIHAASDISVTEGTRIFEAAYYAEFDPVTALDLVNRTPGFNLQQQSGDRGLAGVRSNILINGERPPPKGRSIWQQLSDIPYTSITRIELIDSGATLDIDMQGYPQVVNVILEDDRADFYELNTDVQRFGDGDIRQSSRREIEIDATSSFSLGGHEFTVHGGRVDRSEKEPSSFVAIDPANPEQRISSRDESERESHFLNIGSIFNLNNDSTFSMNAAMNRQSDSSTPVSVLEGPENPDSVRRSSADDEEWREIAAEYRRPVGLRSELMLALVDSRYIDESRSSFVEDGTHLSSVRNRESGESAARLLLSHKLTDRFTLRSTLSTALNYFEGDLQVTENGILVPVDGSDSKVEEDRHSIEFDADWNWRDDWIFRGSISGGTHTIDTHEFSSGTQSETTGMVSVTYQPQERTTITYESRHEIGQLSFNQFLASSNLSSEILRAGAESLEPERQWNHSIDYDRRFGDRGVLKFGFRHQNIQNPVRSVPLSDTLIVSQNTSPEKINRFSASVEYPFERFGTEDLILEAGVDISDSETIDPVTGEKRDVSWVRPLEWSLGMRKDPGEGRWAWGVNLWKRTDNDNYSVRSIREEDRDVQWGAFVEWEIIDGLKLRGRLQGPRNDSEISRFFATIRQVGQAPSYISTTTSRRDSSASFSVEWRRTPHLELTASINPRPGSHSIETLTAFGEPTGSLQIREIPRTPSFQIEVRLYNQ